MKPKLSILFGILHASLFGGTGYIYRSRTRIRIPSPESMYNPAVADAFNCIAGWPQMRLLCWYVFRRIVKVAKQGQAVDIGCGPGHLVFKLA